MVRCTRMWKSSSPPCKAHTGTHLPSLALERNQVPGRSAAASRSKQHVHVHSPIPIPNSGRCEVALTLTQAACTVARAHCSLSNAWPVSRRARMRGKHSSRRAAFGQPSLCRYSLARGGCHSRNCALQLGVGKAHSSWRSCSVSTADSVGAAVGAAGVDFTAVVGVSTAGCADSNCKTITKITTTPTIINSTFRFFVLRPTMAGIPGGMARSWRRLSTTVVAWPYVRRMPGVFCRVLQTRWELARKILGGQIRNRD